MYHRQHANRCGTVLRPLKGTAVEIVVFIHMNINDLYAGKKQRQKERNCAIHTENIHYGEPKRNKSKPKEIKEPWKRNSIRKLRASVAGSYKTDTTTYHKGF